ncbi:reverse transcriptase domain-containing protein [Exiguobacterium mexicanum]|uniref:reverse transcriptase domain-containing protein n=1 Tax=Exiguobacterium mexicanum TaxID=340146 RepID=UPI0037C0AFBC
MNFEEKLIAYGYFFKEIPPEFQSEGLAKVLKKINFDSFQKTEKNFWTKPVTYSVPKIDHFRRIKSIPSPFHQIQLVRLIDKNWGQLEDHFILSDISMSVPIKSSEPNEASVPKISISEKMNIRMNHLHNNNYILQTDISRYFSTIYTHVIPWALHTKDFAKKNMGKNYLGNKIDKLVQYSQDGQTFGIPAGPETSHIISEIIGVRIDKEFKDCIGYNVPGFRFTDDIEYYFDSEKKAKDALIKLHEIVSFYQLDLNQVKTKIIKAPIEFESEWKQFFTRYNFRTSVLGQRSDINTFFSNAFKYKSSTHDKGVLSYALKVVRKEVILKKNWSVFESLLLHSAIVEPHSIPLVIEIIEGYHTKGYDINLKKISEFIEELICVNFPHNNHYEVTWGLVFAKRLEISLSEKITCELSKSNNSIICILTMILKTKGLLQGSFDDRIYKSYLKTEELRDANWLFAYESYIQGWLKPYNNPDYVLKEKFFKILYENKVSFLRNDIDLIELFKEESVKVDDSVLSSVEVESSVKPEDEESPSVEDETPAKPEDEKSPSVEDKTPVKPEDEKSPSVEDETPVKLEDEESPSVEDETPVKLEDEESPSVEDETPVKLENEESSLGESRNSRNFENKSSTSSGDKAELRLEKIYKLLKNSIYENNMWLLSMLNTDLNENQKIEVRNKNEEY